MTSYADRQAAQDQVRREIREGARPPLASRLAPPSTDMLARAKAAAAPRPEPKQHLLPSPEDLLEEYRKGDTTYAAMAERYDVSTTLIGRLIKRALPEGMKVKDYLAMEDALVDRNSAEAYLRSRMADFASVYGERSLSALLLQVLHESGGPVNEILAQAVVAAMTPALVDDVMAAVGHGNGPG